MENTVIAGGNLPAMCRVVCTLVGTGIVGINITGSVTSQTPRQQSLQEGYVAYSDIGVAYKVYDELVIWTEAKKRCIRDGARLAVIDSAKKAQYVVNLKKSAAAVHVGIVRRYNTIWVDDTTGKELEALPWYNGYPAGNDDCVFMQFAPPTVYNSNCGSGTINYVCEIPIIVSRDNGITVN